jgi:predicted Zn-dependent protease
MLSAPDQLTPIRTDLEKAVSLDSGLLEAAYELIAFKIDHKEESAALRDLDTLAGQQPDSAPIHYFRARIYLSLNQATQAVSEARLASRLDPGSLSIYRLLAETLRANNDQEAAITPLDIYTRYAPNDGEALAWLGQAYAAQGLTADATRLLEQALAVDPQSFEVRIIRAEVKIALKDGKAAKDELMTAYAIRPEAFAVYLGLGRAALVNNDSSEAWRNFTGALQRAQTDGERAQSYYWRAQALEAGKQITQALSDWNDLLKLPTQAVPAGLRDTALMHIAALATTTPTPVTPTGSVTPIPSRTPGGTLTPAGSTTVSPTTTVTPTPSATPTVSPTPTR